MELSTALISVFVGALCLLVLSHSTNGVQDDTHFGCEPGWLYFYGTCYNVQGGHINWDAADDKCKQLGAELADLAQRDLRDFIHSQLHFSCTDTNEKECRQRADEGECLKNHDFMAKNCRFSCGFCIGLCENQETLSFCRRYAKMNACNINDYREHMMTVCRKSCGCNGYSDHLWIAKYYKKNNGFSALLGWEPSLKGPFCYQLDTALSRLVETDCDVDDEAGYVCEKPAKYHALPEASKFRKGCPVNGFGYDDKCYILNDHQLRWDDAVDDCAAKNGKLASLDNRDLLEFVTAELMPESGTSWIGLAKNEDDHWQWRNGKIANYLPWDADYDGTRIGSCVQIKVNANNTSFEPDLCLFKKTSVCEIPRAGFNDSEGRNDTRITMDVEYSDCAKSWEEYGEYCYKYFKVKKTWSDAEAHCESLNGDLMSIHGSGALEILERLDQKKPAWIGLRKEARGRRYEWSDESPFDFNFWERGDSEDRLERQCIQMDEVSRRWSGASCETTIGFVCQIWRGYPTPIVQADSVTTMPTPESTPVKTSTQKLIETTLKPSTISATETAAQTTPNNLPTTAQPSITTTVASGTTLALVRVNGPVTVAPKPISTSTEAQPLILQGKITTGKKSSPIELHPVSEDRSSETGKRGPQPSPQKEENGVGGEGKSDNSKHEKGGNDLSSWPISISQIIGILLGCTVFVFFFAVLFVYVSRSSRKKQRMEAAKAVRSVSIRFENRSRDEDAPPSLSTGIVNPTYAPITFVNHSVDNNTEDFDFESSRGFDNFIYNVSTA